MNVERMVPKLTFAAAFLAISQTLWLVTGRFSAHPTWLWILPAVSLAFSIYLARGLRLSLSALTKPNYLVLWLCCFLLASTVWYWPGLKPYLPGDAIPIGPLAFALPWSNFLLSLVVFFSMDPLPESSTTWLRGRGLIPMAMGITGVMGFVYALPEGPLSGTGMVDFMVGGCDWSGANQFFFTKLGLLCTANFAFLIGLQRGALQKRNLLSCFFAGVSLFAYFATDNSCDRAYSHPIGNNAHLLLELLGFSILGLCLIRPLKTLPALGKVGVWFGWNAGYVALFYAFESVTPHWTWGHSWLVGLSLWFFGLFVQAKYWKAFFKEKFAMAQQFQAGNRMP